MFVGARNLLNAYHFSTVPTLYTQSGYPYFGRRQGMGLSVERGVFSMLGICGSVPKPETEY
jgi:hypothetical protein